MNVYEIITQRILDEINKGTLPWHRPWKTVDGEEPTNLSSRKAYRGLNRFLLSLVPYERPFFVTYKQAQEMGGNVKQGEKGHQVIFWKRELYNKKNETTGESETVNGFLLRYYTVFNIAQCDGLEKWTPTKPEYNPVDLLPIERAESIARHYPSAPAVRYKAQSRAYYSPSDDTIVLPERWQFISPAEYYSTLFHELTHSTGHKDRLNRSTLTDLVCFGDTNYSKEELVAELGAAFLCGEAGIENEAALKNSAAYIDGWRRKLSQDSRLIIQAASHAQKAADHILGKTWHE